MVSIVLKLIFYMTGIMFSISHRIGKDHPELATVLGKCLIYGETPELNVLLIWIVIGVGLSWIGICLIYKNENSYVKVS